MSVRKRPSSLKDVNNFIEGKKPLIDSSKEDKHVISLRIPLKIRKQIAEIIEATPIRVSINQWITEAIVEKINRNTN